ncbi:MAG TPA: bacillithiol biosynthesis BshC [Thermoanaerobaculia bacterium]|nr:bacillithiol biosynthesis BshC [Thermoanaerobaculia bacterium]
MTEPACWRAPLAFYPGFNRFVLAWLDGRANEFLPRVTDAPRRAGRRISSELANALIESNQRWGFFVREEVERWARGETYTIVAGQQVGFAGGPLYTLAKIASLIRMKRDSEAAGVPATALFWLATEDHDFAEVATLSLPSRGKHQLDLLHLKATRGFDSRAAVGPLPVPEPLIQEFLAFYDMPRPSWLREGITFRDSFAELLGVAVREGIVLVDALLPELRRAGAPLFEHLVGRSEEIQDDIRKRSLALDAAGYSPQIIARDGEPYTLLFRLDADGNRQPFDGTAANPETISTSALTRPLLQDFVLQPDVFVGGPAEVAYYAQIAGLHQLLGVTLPRVALRGHALVVPKRIGRFFTRFDIAPMEAFSTTDEILADREPQGVAAVRDLAQDAHRELDAAIEKIRELALPADHALARSINRSIGHINYHFDKLTERATRGLVRKDKEQYAATKELVATLYPDRHVQDRVAGWIAYWFEYGELLVDRLVEEIAPDTAEFRIVSL